MRLEEIKNYSYNLKYCYNSIKKIEHIGVGDKFLIKKRFDSIARYEAEIDLKEIKSKYPKINVDLVELVEFSIAGACEKISFFEAYQQKKVKFF